MTSLKNNEKEEQKRMNTIRFINAARQLIDSDGLEQVSIRKIADKAGFHNSTIYLYFKDLDQLIMLASIKYFREYSQALANESRKKRPPADNFTAVWSIFARSIFKEPAIYYNFFFGKRSDNLQDILNTYYDIFPEEREELSEDLESMYFGRNIYERSLKILEPMMQEDTAVTQENLRIINETIVSYCKYKLELKCIDESLDSAKLTTDILDIIHLITGVEK